MESIAVIDALDRAAMPFMIVGSLASNFHGIPRATRDADFVIQTGALDLDQQAAFETVTGRRAIS